MPAGDNPLSGTVATTWLVPPSTMKTWFPEPSVTKIKFESVSILTSFVNSPIGTLVITCCVCASNTYRPDGVLSEATYQHDDIRTPIHYSARQAGELAREAKARRVMLTHLWPTLDPVASVEEGSEAFGRAVSLAAPHLVTHI